MIVLREKTPRQKCKLERTLLLQARKETVTEKGFAVIESKPARRTNTHLRNAADFFEQGQVERELWAVEDPSDHHQYQMSFAKGRNCSTFYFLILQLIYTNSWKSEQLTYTLWMAKVFFNQIFQCIIQNYYDNIYNALFRVLNKSIPSTTKEINYLTYLQSILHF